MIVTVKPSPLSGTIKNPVSSKSETHRALFCAAISDKPVKIICNNPSDDIISTIGVLETFGKRVEKHSSFLEVFDSGNFRSETNVGESGTTLRFALTRAGLYGKTVKFITEGRLSNRPLAELEDVLREHGMTIRRSGNEIICGGKLNPGDYTIPGNVSSQYISSLLLTLPFLNGDSTLKISDGLLSKPYVEMTLDTLSRFNIKIDKTGSVYNIAGNQKAFINDNEYTVSADRSQSAFWFAAGALGGDGITVYNSTLNPPLGDGKIIYDLKQYGANIDILEDKKIISVNNGTLNSTETDCSDTPDIIPILSVIAAFSGGVSKIIGTDRLKFKESDRLEAICNLLNSLKINYKLSNNAIEIHGGNPKGRCTVNGYKDHRIIMSAAIAGAYLNQPVKITDAECINKSYPGFFDDFRSLGGIAEMEEI